jgi:hypothetical protein
MLLNFLEAVLCRERVFRVAENLGSA